MYKYLKKQFASDLLNYGMIRLGTSSSYRNEELLGSAIGDNEENRFGLVERHELLEMDKYESFSPLVKQVMKDKGWPTLDQLKARGETTKIAFFNTRFQLNLSAPDHWMYCTSAVLSQEVRNAFGADVCVRITNPIYFFESIREQMQKMRLAMYSKVRDVLYTDQQVPSENDQGISPDEIKSPRYEYQKEWRLLIRPYQQPIEPFTTFVPATRRYCEMVADSYR